MTKAYGIFWIRVTKNDSNLRGFEEDVWNQHIKGLI